MANTPRYVQSYTLDALTNLPPKPIKANRAPTTADTGYQIGTIWVYVATNQAYVLTSVVSGAANWANLEASGGPGSFTTLTSTGATTLATTGASVNTFGNTTGATSVGILVGTGGFVLTGAASSTIAIGTGVTTGSITIGASQTTGTMNIGGTGAATGTTNIALGTGNQTVQLAYGSTGVKTVNIGGTATTSATTIQSGTGGITLTAPFIALPGPVYIYTGAGAPAGGLALHTGDLYINTSAASTTTRLYIATGAGAWTYFTSNA